MVQRLKIITISFLLFGVLPEGTSAQTFGRPDPCAGTGAAGSSSYGACQLRQTVLERGIQRAPDLSVINESDRMRVERDCASDLARGDDIYAACLRRTLAKDGADPNLPIRQLPDTQREPLPQ